MRDQKGCNQCQIRVMYTDMLNLGSDQKRLFLERNPRLGDLFLYL
jgi:hypothetical protein